MHFTPTNTLSFTRGADEASVFERFFDVVVFGAGYIGWGAVQSFAEQGLQILVIEPSGQLLWESTRALENTVNTQDGCPPWTRWIAGLTARGGAGGGFLDPAFAEINVAREWSDASRGISTLFYAMPVSIECTAGTITALTLATKSGYRQVRGKQWIDASENGLLAVLCQPELRARRRAPLALHHSLVLQSPSWEFAATKLNPLCTDSGADMFRRSFRSGERRFVWLAGKEPWHREMIEHLKLLRTVLPSPSEVIVTQCSAEPFPIYIQCAKKHVRPADNLIVLSPSLSEIPLASIAARFTWGAEAVRLWTGENAGQTILASAPTRSPQCATPEVTRTVTCDVLVAGAGTAGALAALASAREDARTCALEFASFPGGIGTGGGITGYFHGVEGGLQVETDRLTTEINQLLEGRELSARRWHHEGKKLALLLAFEKHGVFFHGNTLLCEVQKSDSGRVTAILAATNDGLVRFTARAFIDSTGDGDLCALAGADFTSGRQGDGRTLAYSQAALMLKSTPDGLVVHARNFDAGWVDPTDPEDLSRARLEGILQHEHEIWSEQDHPFAIAPLLGIRQSRQIRTDYALTFRDLVKHAGFTDSIGEAGSIADTHSVDFEFEDDEALFFYWACRLFRHPLRTQLPYRMLLPCGLDNVWIACRAAGIEVSASYAVRMQRDMQRLGEVAGHAAALASRSGSASREINPLLLRKSQTAAFSPAPVAASASPLELLAAGRTGLHLWTLYGDPETFRTRVLHELHSAKPEASFYAATVLAMWNDKAAEPRLLQAVRSREQGPPPSSKNTGAYDQEIDIPFWLLAVMLLRRCGTARSTEILRLLVGDPANILNVRTALALTVERLATRDQISAATAVELMAPLIEHPLPDRMLAPSRSTWRTLRGEAQITLRNDTGAPTRQDHSWQLHLIVARIRAQARLPLHATAQGYLSDPRALVRHAFAQIATAY